MFSALLDRIWGRRDSRVDFDEEDGNASDTTEDYTRPSKPIELVNVLVGETTHGATISRDDDMVPSVFTSSVDLIKVDMALEGTSCYVESKKDLITPLTEIEGDFYKSEPGGYDPVKLAKACAEYSKDEQLVLHPGNKAKIELLMKTHGASEEEYVRDYSQHYAAAGRVIYYETGYHINNKIYRISYEEFTSPGKRYNNHKVTVSFNGKCIDILSSDTGGVGKFLEIYGNFVNPERNSSGSVINFEYVSFYLEDIMEFLSSDDHYFLGRLLEPHQKIGSVTMIDMSCSDTLLYETPRSIRRFRFGNTRIASIQEKARIDSIREKASKRSTPSVADEPVVSATNEPNGKKTKRGGKPRGRKSSRRKSRRRKSRRRKSSRRK